MIKWLKRTLVLIFWMGLILGTAYLPSWKALPINENRLNIFCWGDILDSEIVEAFERETGIKVSLNYYASNEELLVKLKATRGVGYDLIIPSDYAVKILTEEGLLKEIDKSKLSFWQQLDPRLLGHFYDPENRYSIPFAWEVFCFGIDKQYFQTRSLDPSWKQVFDKESIHYKIAMVNDPIEAILFAAFYLYGPVTWLEQKQIDAVKSLLIEQKEWVEAYANFRGDYFLATKNCPLVVASSSYIQRTKRGFPFIGLIMPKEGSFISIENICIPTPSEKEKLAYRFINFLFRPESVTHHYKTFGFFPVLQMSPETFESDPEMRHLFTEIMQQFPSFHFIKELMRSQEMRDLWVEVKTLHNTHP